MKRLSNRDMSPMNAALRSSGSSSSVSTRASSKESVAGLTKDRQEAEAPVIVRKQVYSPFRRAGLAAAAAVALGWLWKRYLGRVMRSTKKWGPGRLALLLSGALPVFARRLFGVSSYSQVMSDPASVPRRQVLICAHPHGSLVIGAILNVAGQPRNRNSPWYAGCIGIADSLFNIPVVREGLMLINSRPANPRMLDAILAQGKTLALLPGGVHEQMRTDPTQEQCFFAPKLGFVRMALKHGVPLLPMYTFGENQLYDIPKWSRAASGWIKKATGLDMPIPIGLHGLPFVPKPTQVRSYLGRTVEVGPADPDPSDERVRVVFRAYCTELRRLFDEYKDNCLPEQVASKGLSLIWRNHESEDLSADGLGLHGPSAQRGSETPAPLGEERPAPLGEEHPSHTIACRLPHAVPRGEEQIPVHAIAKL